MTRSPFLKIIYSIFGVFLATGSAFAELNDELLKSVFAGDRKQVESMLEMGADIEATTKKGSTALIVAAAQRRTSLVKFLLEQGAKVNAQNRYDDSALLLCATLADRKCMKMFF